MPISTDYKKRLSAIRKTWKESYKKKDEQPGSVPAGEYIVRVNSAVLGESEKGLMKVNWVFVVLSGEGAEVGAQVRDSQNIEGEWAEIGQRSLLSRLSILGIEMDDLEDSAEGLPEVLRSVTAEKPTVRVKITNKTGDDGRVWPRIYFQEAVDPDDIDDDEAEAEEEEEPRPKKKKRVVEEEEEEEPAAKKRVKDDDDEDEEPDEDEEEEEPQPRLKKRSRVESD